MPKNHTGQGNSTNTPVKQEAFQYFMSVHTAIVAIVTEKHQWADKKYHYVDTNAGTGRNDDGTDGSVKISIQKIHERFSGAIIIAIEKNYEAANQLYRETCFMIEQFVEGQIKIIPGDNQMILVPSIIMEPSSGTRFGLVYSDPNGVDDFPNRRASGFLSAQIYSKN